MSFSKKIAPTTVILGLMGTWTAFWSLERMVLYSYSTPDTMVNSTLHNYMPWSDTPEEWKQAFGGAMSQMYAIDREFFSRIIHVQLSGVLALCCLINLYLGDDVAALSDAERLTSTKAWIHRFTGRVFQTCVIPWSLYLNYVLFVHGMINFGPVVDSIDKVASITATLAFGSGLCFIIHSKNIKAHKFCMIVGSAALFVIPVQRLYWFLVMNYMLSFEFFNGNLMNYFMTLDATFVMATLTVIGLGSAYAKDTYGDVKLHFKKGTKKVA
ncbi:hypothetical protein ACHAWT_008996 [Skeletonema menzelii]